MYLCHMDISKYLSNLSIEKLNPMQEEVQALPKENQELLVLSPTGSGKTIAFLLRALKYVQKDVKGVQVLVLAPSRELALQIESVFRKMQTGFKVNCFYGGHQIRSEKQSLIEPADVLIGTPGRIEDLINRELLDLRLTQTLVLDEYDKSLEMGFESQMSAITQVMKKRCNTVITSATKAARIPKYLKLNNVHVIDYLSSADTEEKLKVIKVSCEKQNRSKALFKVVSENENLPSLVFVKTKEEIGDVCESLYDEGVFYTVFHGDLDQMARERNLVKFRNGTANVLVASDLAARGIDIPEIKSVVHYELPDREADFIHRNGRTARMHAEGTAFVLGDSKASFLSKDVEVKTVNDFSGEYSIPEWETVYIDKGRKQKISKGDVAGYLSKNTSLERDEIGLIEVKDFCVFVSIKRAKTMDVLSSLKKVKIKGKSCRVEVAK